MKMDQGSALLHFTRNGAFGPAARAARAEPWRGALRVRHPGPALPRRPVEPVLRPARLLLRREIAAVASEQLQRLAFNTLGHRPPPRARAGRTPAAIAPKGIEHVFFTSGGSEAVEAAWKLVRQYHLAHGEPQRRKAIARNNAYHGVTLGALSFTGVPGFKEPFGRPAIDVAPRRQHQPFRREISDERADARAAGRDRADDHRRGPGDVRAAHRRAGAERRRLPRPARRATGPGCARSATATGSCSWPTR